MKITIEAPTVYTHETKVQPIPRLFLPENMHHRRRSGSMRKSVSKIELKNIPDSKSDKYKYCAFAILSTLLLGGITVSLAELINYLCSL